MDSIKHELWLLSDKSSKLDLRVGATAYIIEFFIPRLGYSENCRNICENCSCLLACGRTAVGFACDFLAPSFFLELVWMPR